MESEDSVPHSQGLSNNSYHDQNQPNSSYDTYFFKILLTLPSRLQLGLHKSLFPVDVHDKILAI